MQDRVVERPWVTHYDAGVPASLAPYPERTLLAYVAAQAREWPQHPVIWFKGVPLTASRLERLSNAFAAALVRLGVRKGERVALLLPNCPQFIIAELGAWKAGAVVVPLSPLYTEDELATLLAHTGSETIVTLTSYYARVKAVQGRAGVRRVIATSIKEHLPPLVRVLFTVLREKREGHYIALEPGDMWFRDLIERHLDAMRPDVTVAADDPATLLPGSGISGFPKAVLGTHRNMVITGAQITAWLGDTAEKGGVMLLPLPLYHMYGLNVVQSVAFMNRMTLALVPNPDDINDVLDTIREVRPTYFSGVPDLYGEILDHPDVKSGKVDLSSIKLALSGAETLNAEHRRRFEELTGGRVIEGYGMTESQSANTINPVRGPTKTGSVGLPLPDTDVRIVDPNDERRQLAAGETGEILLYCPQHMASYWREPEETSDTLRTELDGRVWIRTGDLGYLDEDGYLFLVDSKAELKVLRRKQAARYATRAPGDSGGRLAPDAVPGA
ncbi:MAG: AMP-binding protein [Gemmatimonadota bacterium]|nr:AMP-binding protein [Gemmatimonadota bacterium]